MRKLMISVAAVAALLGASAVVWAAPSASRNFGTHLSGNNEVPPRDTQAQGHATLKVSEDGSSISYRVVVANIENVVAAHIHCAEAGVNGSVGVTLFSGGVPGGGRTQGVLSSGTITTPDAGNACGWTDVEDVVEAMLSGDTYINVHTNDGVAPTNTGPGDFPGGEIRGQVGENGPS